MRAVLLLYVLLLTVGHVLWPWLRELDLVGLPGDSMFTVDGRGIHLSFTSALIPTAILSSVWVLLNR